MAEEYIEAKIRIGKLVTTRIGLVYLIFSLIIIILLFFPWVHLYLYITPTRVTDAYYGEYGVTVNGLGLGSFVDRLYYIIDRGNVRSVEDTHTNVFSPVIFGLGVLALVGAIVGILVFLHQSDLLPPNLARLFTGSKKKERVMNLLGSILALSSTLLVGILYNYLNIPILQTSNIGELKVAILKYSRSLESLYVGRLIVDPHFSIGIGASLAFVVSLLWFIYSIDQYFFKRILNLRTTWRIKISIFTLIAIASLYPWAGSVTITSWNYWLGVSTPNGLFLFVIAIMGIFIIFFTSQRVPAGVLMREEEFISLALSPEELARRAKLLPIYMKVIKRFSLIILILWFIILWLFISVVRGVFAVEYTRLVREAIGMLWTELPSWLILIGSIIGIGSHAIIE